MTWLKLDDRLLDHPKFVRLEREAPSRGIHLWLGLMAYCKQHLSDGRVPVDMVRSVNGPALRWRPLTLASLINVGLVDRVGDGELLIHDYFDWNPSRAEVEKKNADRKAAAEARRQRSDRKAIEERSKDDRKMIAKRPPAPSNDLGHLSGLRTPPETETETETETMSRTPSPPLGLGATEAKKKSRQAPGGAGKVAKSRCPADFTPTADTLTEATKLGFGSKLELETRAEFIDHWLSVGELRSNWQATYRNRLRYVAKREGLKPPRRDEQWKRHQEQLRKAERVDKPVPPPPGFEAQVRSLFG